MRLGGGGGGQRESVGNERGKKRKDVWEYSEKEGRRDWI